MTGLISKTRHTTPILIALLAASLLSACAGPAASGKRAPIVEYGAGPVPYAAEKPAETSTIYVVQAGDTLYSIAFLNGLDYMEVAQQNGLKDPTAIQVGQRLRLIVPAEEVVSEVSVPATMRLPRAGEVKNQPKVGRLLYSAQALAKPWARWLFLSKSAAVYARTPVVNKYSAMAAPTVPNAKTAKSRLKPFSVAKLWPQGGSGIPSLIKRRFNAPARIETRQNQFNPDGLVSLADRSKNKFIHDNFVRGKRHNGLIGAPFHCGAG